MGGWINLEFDTGKGKGTRTSLSLNWNFDQKWIMEFE